MSQTTSRYTVEQFLALPLADEFELHDGILVPRPITRDAARTAGRLSHLLTAAAEHNPGRVHGSSLALQLWPERPAHILRADVAFISDDRLDDVLPGSPTMHIPPDIIAEVVPPSVTAIDLEARVNAYLEGGVSLAWLLYPAARHVYVYRGNGTVTALWPTESLTGENILPAFAMPVRELFD